MPGYWGCRCPRWLHCETADGTEVVIQLNSSRASAITPGTRVSLGLESDGVLVVPAG